MTSNTSNRGNKALPLTKMPPGSQVWVLLDFREDHPHAHHFPVSAFR